MSKSSNHPDTDGKSIDKSKTQMAGDGGQTLSEAQEHGRQGAQKAAEMREKGELPPDNGAGTSKHSQNEVGKNTQSTGTKGSKPSLD